MNILVIGGGGREHAIIHSLIKNRDIEKIWCAPGNGGIAAMAECVPVKATDLDGIIRFCRENPVGYVVVAPDDPLALGLVDMLEAEGIPAFGPRKNAAIIESSKIFSKNLMKKYNIPTAKYEVFDNPDSARAYIERQGAPIVVKADGLALGKGVVVAQTVGEAVNAVSDMMESKIFGAAGTQIVVEEFMTGPEVTVLCFTDGISIAPMPSSQDHKPALDGGLGPNTGGMGAVSPVPCYTPEIAARCMREIFMPTIRAMAAEGRPFKGVLYFGLMITPDGPRVVEYNARFGDPETQTVLPLLDSDLLSIMRSVTEERLTPESIKWKDLKSCCVVLASGGYPASYETGFEIMGLDTVPPDITVFHAGTKLEGGKHVTAGGRVLGVAAASDTLAEAVSRAYAGTELISFKNMHYRRDIGHKAQAD